MAQDRRTQQTCEQCDRAAVFETPLGSLCPTHAREAMEDAERPWKPTRLNEGEPADETG